MTNFWQRVSNWKNAGHRWKTLLVLLSASGPVDFSWSLMENAVTYRFEVEGLRSTPVISAILPKGVGSYRAPSWFQERVGNAVIRWRVVAFDGQGSQLSNTEWRALRISFQTRSGVPE